MKQRHSLVSLIYFSISCLAFSIPHPPPALIPIPSQEVKPDPYMDKMWHLNAIRAFDAWKVTEGSPDITVAVIDSGINYNNPDLAPNIRRKKAEFPLDGTDKDGNGFIDDVIGWDFVRSLPLPFDRSGHGSFMAGIIAAVRNNGVGGAGVCPKCSLLPVRFINYEGAGDDEDSLKAIYYAANEGASVLNISFAGEGYDADLKKALEFAGSKDAVVVVSASNDGENLDNAATYPAKFQMPHMLTVGASDPQDALMEGSNWGHKTVSMMAPGEDILGIWFEKWDKGSGTSQAAAVASGVVGLVRSADKTLTAEEAVRIIRQTVRKVSSHSTYSQTSGVINTAEAVKCAKNPAHPCL